MLVARIKVVALTLVKMCRFENILEVDQQDLLADQKGENEGKRGFQDTSRFLDSF